MAALSDPVKLALVQALACYDTPSQEAELVKQEFGIEVRRQQVATYDPTKGAGRNQSKKLVDIFLSDSRGNSATMLLEQAAKEFGGALTSRRELTGKGGSPIAQAVTTVTAGAAGRSSAGLSATRIDERHAGALWPPQAPELANDEPVN